MPLDQIVAECREWFLDPDFRKLRALREGTPPARLIGLFPVYTPEEVVELIRRRDEIFARLAEIRKTL